MKSSNLSVLTGMLFIWASLYSVQAVSASGEAGHHHMKKASKPKNGAKSEARAQFQKGESCNKPSVKCAKTVTSAFAPNGDLWRLWVHKGPTQGQRMYFQISQDDGKHFGDIKHVDIAPEPISARNENRPKIAFDQPASGEPNVYLSWASSLGKRFTSNVRFTWSTDYGKHFNEAVTVNDDGLITGHSFNEMLVDGQGNVTLVWLDSRHRYLAKQEGREEIGSSLYLGTANPVSSASSTTDFSKSFAFENSQLANRTCVCCRIATDVNQQGNPVVLWRHIYGDHIREFALMTLGEDKEPIQISHDEWRIEGCPHQGGGVSVDTDNNYHLVWFNQGKKGQGIFYSFSTDKGHTLSKPLSVGNKQAGAAHAHVMSNQVEMNGKAIDKTIDIVDIVWTEFNGEQYQLWHQSSLTNGDGFNAPKIIATSTADSDRPFLLKKGQQTFVSWQRPKQGHFFHALDR